MANPVKGRRGKTRLVAVISRGADFDRAGALRSPPDFFELRLDALLGREPGGPEAPGRLMARLARLRAPLLITARDPAEGGENSLAAGSRLALLRQFLPLAAAVDVELRNARRFARFLTQAAGKQLVLSVHRFSGRTRKRQLVEWRRRARDAGANILKVVVRADQAADLEMLCDFVRENPTETCAIGVGRLGRKSRIALPAAGSALAYAHLGKASVPGQLSLETLRHALGR